MRTLVVATLLAYVCSGCTGHEVLRPTTPLDEASLSRGVASGTSTVQGQAFLKTVGGDVKYAAGDMIYLCPESIGKYLIEVANLRQDEAPPVTVVAYDQRAERACRSMKGDGQGRFRFTGVAEGEYTLAAWIVWGVTKGSTTFSGATANIAASWTFLSTGATGGLTTATVTVREAETAEVIVNELTVPAL